MTTSGNVYRPSMRGGVALLLALGSIVAVGEVSGAGDIQTPKGSWQVPGAIQQPKGPWQTPGAIQVPRGIEAIKREDLGCQHRLDVGADALFAFDKAELSPEAEETLSALGPEIAKLGQHPAQIEGHTDSSGAISYDQRLSEHRADAVKRWLVGHKFVAESTPTKGYGKTRPMAANTNPDGSDNPEGRQKNRRVEVVVDSCRS